MPGIDLVDHALHQVAYVRLLTQVPVGGVRQPALLRPLTDRVQLDADQGGQVRPAVTDDDCFLDIRRGLQRILDLGRRDVLPASGDDDVLHPVGDLHVGAVHPLADVAGVQPTVRLLHRGGGGRIPPVADEYARVPGEDFPGALVDAQLDPVVRLADRAQLDVAGPVRGGHRAVLGHAVHLVHRHADPHVELEHVRRDRRGTGGGVPDPAHADPLPQRSVAQQPADRVAQPGARGVPPAGAHQRVADLAGHPQPEPGVGALERGGREQPGVDLGEHLLPDPRYPEQDGGLHLAQVGDHGVHRLGEVDLAAGRGVEPGGEDALGHVAEREVGHQQVVVARRRIGEPTGHDQRVDRELDVGDREHHALGRPGGPRRVDQGHDVVGAGLCHPVRHRTRMRSAVFLAQFEQLRPGQQLRVVVAVPDAARLQVDDPL
jgi:hypothetical protein